MGGLMDMPKFGPEPRRGDPWTRPYYGITHRLISEPFGRGRLQLTVEDSGTYARAYLLNLTSAHPFTACFEAEFEGEGRTDSAKRYIEGKAGLT